MTGILGVDRCSPRFSMSARGVRLCCAREPDDVSKSSRPGLDRGLPREVGPLEGPDYARPAVTLAPDFSFFLGDVTCQSATERF
jgi:hypothetical protein